MTKLPPYGLRLLSTISRTDFLGDFQECGLPLINIPGAQKGHMPWILLQDYEWLNYVCGGL